MPIDPTTAKLCGPSPPRSPRSPRCRCRADHRAVEGAERPATGPPDGGHRPGVLARDGRRRRAHPAPASTNSPAPWRRACAGHSTAWRHMRADMVVEPVVDVPKVFTGLGSGIRIVERRATLDPGNAVVGHQLRGPARDARRTSTRSAPGTVELDAAATAANEERAHALLDGILGVRMQGMLPRLLALGRDRAVARGGSRPDGSRGAARAHAPDHGAAHRVHARDAGPARGEGFPRHRAGDHPLRGRVHRRASRGGLRSAHAPGPRPLDLWHGADFFRGLPGHAPGVRARLRGALVRALRPGLLRLLRAPRRQARPRQADPPRAEGIDEPLGERRARRGADRARTWCSPASQARRSWRWTRGTRERSRRTSSTPARRAAGTGRPWSWCSKTSARCATSRRRLWEWAEIARGVALG